MHGKVHHKEGVVDGLSVSRLEEPPLHAARGVVSYAIVVRPSRHQNWSQGKHEGKGNVQYRDGKDEAISGVRQTTLGRDNDHVHDEERTDEGQRTGNSGQGLDDSNFVGRLGLERKAGQGRVVVEIHRIVGHCLH